MDGELALKLGLGGIVQMKALGEAGPEGCIVITCNAVVCFATRLSGDAVTVAVSGCMRTELSRQG